MKIVCIIPVTNLTLFKECLVPSININTILPDTIIIVDNVKENKEPLAELFNTPAFTIKHKNHDLGFVHYFNESLIAAFKFLTKDTDIVCILNDDIILNRYFFAHLQYSFNVSELYCTYDKNRLGILLPYVIKPPVTLDPMFAYNKVSEDNLVTFEKKKEGCCICIRKSVLDILPLIPAQLTMFYGDSWIFHWVHRLGYLRGNMKNNWIYHFVGSSTRKNIGKFRVLRVYEKAIYAALIKEPNSMNPPLFSEDEEEED